MKTLKEFVADARQNQVAIGHFNISNIETLHGIYDAAKTLDLPVIIGVSEGERDFIGIKEVCAIIKTLREEDDYPIFLNADHTYSFDRVKEAIDTSFDSVIFDGAKLSLEENILETKKCVDYARSTGKEVLIEAELGYIGQSSKMLDDIPAGIEMTSIEDAKRFVIETGIDLFAPAVGNIHGMLKSAPNPHLDSERVRLISEATDIPLVLHGASGNSKEDIQACIKAGVAIVHVNTEIRVAFKEALEESLKNNPDEVAPYKIERSSVEAVRDVVLEKLKIFNFID